MSSARLGVFLDAKLLQEWEEMPADINIILKHTEVAIAIVDESTDVAPCQHANMLLDAEVIVILQYLILGLASWIKRLEQAIAQAAASQPHPVPEIVTIAMQKYSLSTESTFDVLSVPEASKKSANELRNELVKVGVAIRDVRQCTRGLEDISGRKVVANRVSDMIAVATGGFSTEEGDDDIESRGSQSRGEWSAEQAETGAGDWGNKTL